jgi:tetratricopeptide (TPR) repeat protein/predicted aspartyl protease
VRKNLTKAAAALVLSMGVHARGEAACSIGKMAELPVTMDQMGPMIDAKINGTPVRFIADSGAFYSIISPGNAQSLHLAFEPAPFGFAIRGINGSASASIVTVKTFTIAGVDIPRVQFIVAGSELRGVGVVGQNVLGIGDVEYDLPHGVIRLMKSAGCERANLAYWAAGRSYSMIPIEPRSPQNPHTIGTVYINGKPIRATFDTGASTSILTLSAAARAGIKPDSPGVTNGGSTYGFGRNLVRTWIAPIQSFAIGDGEQIQHARIRIGAMTGNTDMLIGADFFIAHHVYVDNRDHRLFLTYEGGPVFNLKARFDGPPATDGAVAAATAAAPPADAESHSRDGAVAEARDDLDGAVAEYSKAITMAPSEPRYLDQRADVYFRQRKPALGRADLDRAIALDPTDSEALLERAALYVHQRDKPAALADLDVVDRTADAASMDRLRLGDLLTDAGQPQRAVGVFDQWIKAHPDDVRRPVALNDRCWAHALAGQDLDAALRDCNAALRLRPGTANFLDSRGTVQLRRGEWAKALADFDAALAGQPKLAWSLYGRGIAKLRSGDAAGGKADMAAAVAIRPGVADDARSYGIAP